jgi:AcrR family transcriptional regulator
MSSKGDEPAERGGAAVARAETRAKGGPRSREEVAQTQRERILQAAVGLIAERTLRNVTAQSVIERAGVSRRTLYDLFGSMEDVAVAAVALARRRAIARVSEAFARDAEWPERVLAGLVALLVFLDDEPQLARVCLVEAFATGPVGLSVRARDLQELVPLVDAGRAHAPDERLSVQMAEATVAAVAGILHIRLVTGEAPPFIGLLGELAGVVLSPYLDAESLQRELAKAQRLASMIAVEPTTTIPPAHPRVDVEVPRSVGSLGAYRARGCLLHLAEHPGASNAQVAHATGVRYQGQMSTLLTRLEREGLLVKRSKGAGRANEWRLTPHGESVARALADKL